METINTVLHTDNVGKSQTGWRIDKRKGSIKIIDVNYNPVASIMKEEDAALIVKAINNHYALIEALKNEIRFIKCCPELANEERRPRGLEKWETLLNTINESK